jgi:hypothetical protein
MNRAICAGNKGLVCSNKLRREKKDIGVRLRANHRKQALGQKSLRCQRSSSGIVEDGDPRPPILPRTSQGLETLFIFIAKVNCITVKVIVDAHSNTCPKLTKVALKVASSHWLRKYLESFIDSGIVCRP